MAAALKLAGYALTPAQWAAVDPRTRVQLLQLALPHDEAPQAPSPDEVPGTTVWPGPDPGTVIIHAAAPARAATQPPRRARRTSDVD